jgi:glycosyltransferase involved in cell wall biosynthesis
MKKVLNIITDMNIGGAGIVLQNYYAKADRERFEHFVVLPQGSMLADRLRSLEVEIIEIPGIKAKSLDIPAIKAFRKKFEEINPDIVHTHASLSARIAARQFKKCAIVHTRHCAYPQSKFKTSFPMKQLLGCINNYYSDLIIAVSPACGENLTDTGTKAEKITTVFNGVQPVRRLSDDEKNELRDSLGIDKNDFVCSIVARLVPEKGHIYVLEAAKLLKDLPLKIIIAGSGSSEGELHAFAKQHELDNCIFTGFINDIAGVENISDFQLNASYGTEASSLSLLESMSLSIPAVASDFGGNPYLIEDGVNGYIVPQHSGEALANAIRKMIENPKTLSKMGVNANEIYKERFTAEVMAGNIEKVYEQVLSNKR